MNVIKLLLFVVLIVSIDGCGQIFVNIGNDYTINKCMVKITDIRPDKRIITGVYGNTFDISPPIRDVIYSKSCRNNKINEASKNSDFIIRIRDIKYNDIVHLFSVESILIIDGSVQYDGKYHEIQTSSTLDQCGWTISERLSTLINDALDKYVSEVSKLVM